MDYGELLTIPIVISIFIISKILINFEDKIRKENVSSYKASLLAIKEHRLIEINKILNSGAIPYNNYLILIGSENAINFGYQIYLYVYVIDWYDYVKLKDLINITIYLADINELKESKINLETDLCEVTLAKTYKFYKKNINYNTLESFLDKRKI
jgi:hypothetical protein